MSSNSVQNDVVNNKEPSWRSQDLEKTIISWFEDGQMEGKEPLEECVCYTNDLSLRLGADEKWMLTDSTFDSFCSRAWNLDLFMRNIEDIRHNEVQNNDMMKFHLKRMRRKSEFHKL